jgi:hypothetical protein
MGRTFNRQRDWDRPSKMENRSEKSFDKYKKSIYNRMSLEQSLDDDHYDIDEEDNDEVNTTPIQRK